MKEKIEWIPKTLLLILTFLLPLKFGSTIAVPEMPMSYWNDPLSILVASWPVLLFPVCAATVLVFSLIFWPRPAHPVKGLRLYGWLWGLLTAASLPGWVHSTTWDFAAQHTAHLLGLLCWTLALIRILEADPRFARKLTGALIAGLVFSVYSAFSQYFTGFDDTLKYVQEKEIKSGISILEGQFGSRLREARVSADFAVCNSYAGYLLLVFPFLIGLLWQLGGRIRPPLPSRLVLTLPAAGIFLFLLKETGSRGAVLALGAGGVLALLGMKLSRRWKIGVGSLIPLSAAGLGLLILFRDSVNSSFTIFGRGINSMLIRLDYFQAAFRMMLLRPFTGAGWGEFLNDYLILKNVVNDEAPHSPHNLSFTLGSQCGFFAFLLSILLLMLPLAAALLLLRRKSQSESPAQCGPEIALVCALGAWTFHSMLDLNYETPGCFGMAVVLSVLILLRSDPPGSAWLPDSLSGSGRIFWFYCAAAAAAALLFTPPVIRAEMNFDALYSMTDPRFSDRFGGNPQPAVVRDQLAQCDQRSPFPFASASNYFLTLGPYYIADAVELLDQAIARTPKRAAFYFRKYQILKNLPDRREEAETCLTRARQLSPRNPRYYPGGVTPYGKRSY